MLLDETPNTIAYLIVGYAVFFGLPFLYVIGGLLRRRNLEKDVELIQTLTEDDPAQPAGRDDPARAGRRDERGR